MSAAPDDWGARWADDLRRESDGKLGVDPLDDSWMRDNPDAMGLPLTWADKYDGLKVPETAVGGLIEAGSLVLVYAESGAGKSTFVLDIALACARGVPWRGRRTRKGFVIWIALEGARGLRQRVVAYMKQNGITEPLAFADISEPICLIDDDERLIEAVVTTIKAVEAARNEPCAMLVVDTLARAICSGDENDGPAMGALIKTCDAIRYGTGVSVVLIHHSGKDTTRGARGHSSLRAAVDTEIEVTGRTNPRTAKVTKQRDLPAGDEFAFDLEPVELGADPVSFEAITSTVVVHLQDVPEKRKEPRGSNQQLLLAGIREHVRASGSAIVSTIDLREIAKAQGLKDRRRFSEARESIERDGWITACTGGYQFAGDVL